MNSSRNSDLILSVFSDTRTVFSLTDIAMLFGESDFKKINELKKMNWLRNISVVGAFIRK